MELRQLEYLIAVAEEANFTRAAERVHISQSGVSAQIRQLEHDLGVTLIDRSSRTARLTDAGTAAVTHARAALSAVAALRQAVDEVNGLIRGQLAVGMVTACTVTGLFDALAEFHLAHPGVAITLVEDNSASLIERVRSGMADLALIGASGGPPLGLDALPIASERLAAAVPPGHPLLTGRPGVTLADLAGYPVVCMPSGSGIRNVLDQACTAQGVRPDIAMEASAPGAVADLAARGLGVAVLSESMAASHSPRLRVLPIDDVDIPALLALIWKPAPSRALREFLRHCRQAFAVPQPAAALRDDDLVSRHPLRPQESSPARL
jgi:DNA-binding transcriptional LysR family regulator